MYTCLCQCSAKPESDRGRRPSRPREPRLGRGECESHSDGHAGKGLAAARIIAMLPMHYDLSALMRKATQDAEPKASGGPGTCDVTFGTVPWADRRHRAELRRALAVRPRVRRRVGLAVPACRHQARAHVLNSLPPEKREKFIKVKTELYVCILTFDIVVCLEICEGNRTMVYSRSQKYLALAWLRQ